MGRPRGPAGHRHRRGAGAHRALGAQAGPRARRAIDVDRVGATLELHDGGRSVLGGYPVSRAPLERRRTGALLALLVLAPVVMIVASCRGIFGLDDYQDSS